MTTDHYSQCESGLIALLQTMVDIFPHDWQVSDNEANRNLGADNFFIVRPGGFPNTPLSTQEVLFSWQIVGDLYVKYIEQAKSLRQFKAVRAAIIEMVYTHPTLDGRSNVQRVGIDSDELTQYFRFDENSEKPNFIIQTMRVTALQRVLFSGGEL